MVQSYKFTNDRYGLVKSNKIIKEGLNKLKEIDQILKKDYELLE